MLSSGSEGNSASGEVTYSVGLIHFKETTAVVGASTTGRQIQFEVSQVLSINDFSRSITKVFPNSTEDYLNSIDDLNYQLFDLSERQITSGKLNTLQPKLKLSYLETLIYILDILKNSTLIQSYKISKK